METCIQGRCKYINIIMMPSVDWPPRMPARIHVNYVVSNDAEVKRSNVCMGLVSLMSQGQLSPPLLSLRQRSGKQLFGVRQD